ncbi:hypothetical protein [Azorhizobium caulinodans]|uniref:hypothetical protein n=1 Tax=Azorhizobium caulinodans TaxID=7 RepID=UPI002FBDDD40
MDTKEFSELVKKTLDGAGGADRLSSCLSKPSSKLISQYGPLTEKVAKDRAVLKARELYNKYMVETSDQEFADALSDIAGVVRDLPSHVSNGGISAAVVLSYQVSNFPRIVGNVIQEVKEPKGGVSGLLLMGMDTAVATGLAFVPVAGPFLAALSQGLGNAVSFGANSLISKYAKTPSSPIFASNPSVSGGLVQDLASSTGVVTVIATLVKYGAEKRRKSILAADDNFHNRPFATMMQGQIQTQNQVVGEQINTLKMANINLPNVLRDTSDRTSCYKEEGDTLRSFVDKASETFDAFNQLLNQIITAGVMNSFSEATKGLQDLDLTPNQRVAILILGYFYSKSWGADKSYRQVTINENRQNISAQRTGINELSNEMSDDERTIFLLESSEIRFRDVETLREAYDRIATNKGEIEKKKKIIEMLERQNLSLLSTGTLKGLKQHWGDQSNTTNPLLATSYAAFQKTSESLRKGTFKGKVFDRNDMDLAKLPQFKNQARAYFQGLKDALVSDISSAMTVGSSEIMTDTTMTEMWKLYIGCNLIVNQVLSEGKLLETSALSRFKNSFSKGAIEIDDRYIKLLEDAGFIQRHTNWTLNEQEKMDMARQRKLRWARRASDSERAMVIAFSTVVAFSLDVGRISLGFCSWRETKQGLGKLCEDISMAVIQNQKK